MPTYTATAANRLSATAPELVCERFAKGHVAAITGVTGSAKSWLATQFASQAAANGPVLYFAPGNTFTEIILPRYTAINGDRTRLYCLRTDTPDAATTAPHPLDDTKDLEDAIKQLKPVLLIVDDLLTDPSRKEIALAVDRIATLRRIARTFKCAVLVTINAPKRGGRPNALPETPAAIEAIVSVNYLVAQDSQSLQHFIFMDTKNPFRPHTAPTVFHLTRDKFHWDGQVDPTQPNAPSAEEVERAKTYLLRTLQQGPVESRILLQEAPCPKNILCQVKELLGIIGHWSDSEHATWAWKLPDPPAKN